MKLLKNILTPTILVLLAGCSSTEDKNMIEYTRDDFSATFELTGNPLWGDSIVNPDEAYIVRDSMVLVSNDDPAQGKKVKLFSLRDGHLISSYFSKGHAENEVISCDLKYFSLNDKYFYIDDFTQGKYFVCSLDSMCKNRNPILRSFYYSRDIISVFPLDTTYIGFSSWFIDEDKYYNGISCPIGMYNMDNSKKNTHTIGCKYFVANVSGACVVKNPHNDDVWVSYRHNNIIEIYDKDLILKKKLAGPEKSKGKYKTETIKKQQYVFFDQDSYISSFYSCFFSKQYVYLLYENKNGTTIPPKPVPSEIFKFNWNGKPICNYKLDRQAYEISIDSKEHFLLAICMDKSNNLQVVKFDLK